VKEEILENSAFASRAVVRFAVFSAMTMKNGVFWDIKTQIS
jgi:hypothetical protein